MKNRKGVVTTWIYILVGIFIIGLIYIIFSYILYSDVGIATMVNSTNATQSNPQAQTTINVINAVWRFWPLPLIFGLILWGIISSQRREPDLYSGYQLWR